MQSLTKVLGNLSNSVTFMCLCFSFYIYIYIASVTFKIVSRELLLMAGWAKKGGTDRNTRLVWNRHVEIH